MERIRFARLSPYRKGMGPTFRVEIWDTYSADNRGCTRLIARLLSFENGKRTHVLDMPYCNGPHASDDGDESMAMAITAVAMKPGDTDDEFFADYTPEQIAFVEQHGETIAFEATVRYGEDY